MARQPDRELGTRLQVSAATNSELASENAELHTLLTAKQDAERAFRASVKALDTAIKNSEDFVRPVVRRLKSEPDYTPGDGAELQVVGPEVNGDLSDKAPDLKAKTDAQGVEFSYVRGPSGGINIYCQRANETNFSFFQRLTRSKGRDNRPNLNPGAEERQYYAVYVVADNEVGLQSAIVTVRV